jgi:hypothetical protein
MQNLQNSMQNQTTILLQWSNHLCFLFLLMTTKSSHTFTLLAISCPKRKRLRHWPCRTQDTWLRFSNRNHNPNHPPLIHMPILFSINDFLDPINEDLIDIPNNSLMITSNSPRHRPRSHNHGRMKIVLPRDLRWRRWHRLDWGEQFWWRDGEYLIHKIYHNI